MDIYQPEEDSYLLQKYVKKYAAGRVLDMGTGSGIQALTAAENKDVREIVAVDINKKAVKNIKNKKITAFYSDLFSEVTGKFNTIIFNPPYLPQDWGIKERALYGGNKGYEISVRFIEEVNKYLVSNGQILFLFSSHTNREIIELSLKSHLLDFKILEEKYLGMFETLYVYLIEKSPLLRELEKKHLENVRYLCHGKRGMIYTAEQDQSNYVKTHLTPKKTVKVAIKVKNEESQAVGRMENEAKWLKVLNKHNLGPKFLFSGKDYLVYEFVEGQLILEWVEDKSRKEIKNVLINVLNQCYQLDKLGVNKKEMHHPQKHIIVGDKVVLLDFERCVKTEKPHNVTQFVEFICRMKFSDVTKLRKLAQEYKHGYSKDVFAEILKEIQ